MAIRVNLAPAVLVAAAYICRRQVSEKWLPIILGGLVAFILAGMLDAFTWRYPFQSFVANIWINVIENKSQSYGTEPWYYFAKIGRLSGAVLLSRWRSLLQLLCEKIFFSGLSQRRSLRRTCCLRIKNIVSFFLPYHLSSF